jgi:hypothetical protein
LDSGEKITPGLATDDVDSDTNICFLPCRELDFPGSAFFRDEPKKEEIKKSEKYQLRSN